MSIGIRLCILVVLTLELCCAYALCYINLEVSVFALYCIDAVRVSFWVNILSVDY